MPCAAGGTLSDTAGTVLGDARHVGGPGAARLGHTGDDELGRHTRFRGELRQRGERYVLGVPCTTAVRDLEGPSPAYHGRGRRPKAPWQSVTHWRQALPGKAWTHLTVRDGEKGPVEIAMVRRRVQTRIERKRTRPEK